jgi:hypothetical protein
MMEISDFNCRMLFWARSYHKAKAKYSPPPTQVVWQAYHEAAVKEEQRELDGPGREPEQHAIGKEDLDDGKGIGEDSCIRMLESL